MNMKKLKNAVWTCLTDGKAGDAESDKVSFLCIFNKNAVLKQMCCLKKLLFVFCCLFLTRQLFFIVDERNKN